MSEPTQEMFDLSAIRCQELEKENAALRAQVKALAKISKMECCNYKSDEGHHCPVNIAQQALSASEGKKENTNEA